MFFISLFNLSIQSWHAFELVLVFLYNDLSIMWPVAKQDSTCHL